MATDLGKLLRRQIKKSGRTVNGIAVEAGISQTTLWHFVNGHQDIRLSTASKLFDLFGLCVAKENGDLKKC